MDHKPPTAVIEAAHGAQSLPFHDTTDFEYADRGFIAALTPCVVKAADGRVVSRATVSNIPAFPKKLPTVLIAAFATLILSAGLVVTREILSAPAGYIPVRGDPTASAAG